MLHEYACPRCGKKLLILDVHQGGYQYKLVCHNCSYYEYEVGLDKLKEFKDGTERKEDQQIKHYHNEEECC